MKIELLAVAVPRQCVERLEGRDRPQHVLFPEWRFSPFLTLGTGYVETSPRATIVLPLDREDQTAYAGAGVRFYLTRRFFLRADYRWHTMFTSRDDNEELEEWKVRIACFF